MRPCTNSRTALSITEDELLAVCGKLEQGLEGPLKINKHAISSFAGALTDRILIFKGIQLLLWFISVDSFHG